MLNDFNTINFDSVADIYDLYVNTTLDNNFFINESSKVKDEILELMCGTGRLSIPLLEKGFRLTCVDYMGKMLNVFKDKIKEKNYDVNIIEMDVTKLNLNKKFNLILLPFNSFSEILDTAKQETTITKIYEHLNKDGIFICTLHNPVKRILSIDKKLHALGKYKTEGNQTLVVSYENYFNKKSRLVSGKQYYYLYDENNILIRKRTLDVNFRLIYKDEFEKLILKFGFAIEKTYGNYDYSEFNENESPFIIWVLRK